MKRVLMSRGADTVVKVCAGVQPEEQVLVVTEAEMMPIAHTYNPLIRARPTYARHTSLITPYIPCLYNRHTFHPLVRQLLRKSSVVMCLSPFFQMSLVIFNKMIVD
jgi:hypothetical protein